MLSKIEKKRERIKSIILESELKIIKEQKEEIVEKNKKITTTIKEGLRKTTKRLMKKRFHKRLKF